GSVIGAALGAQVAIINDTSTPVAEFKSGTSGADGVRIAGSLQHLQIQARVTRDLTAKVAGAAATTGIAAGAPIARIPAGGAPTATIGDYARLVVPTAKSVTVASSVIDDLDAEAIEVAAGIGAGAGNEATATDDPTVNAALGVNVRILVQAPGVISVTAA